MRSIGRAAVAAAMAVALLLVGALVLVRGPGGPAQQPSSPAIPASGALLVPAASTGSLESTISALQTRLRVNPNDWRGYASLGLAYLTQARVTADPSWYPKAEGVLRESLRLRGEGNLDAQLGLGALALARHDFETALDRGRAAEAVNPYNANVYGVIGDALLELGRYEEAVDAFQTMIDTRPGIPSYARASYARELLGDVPGAIDAMGLALDAAGSPSDGAWAAYQLGELEFGRGAVGEAETWYEQGLRLDPSYAPNLAGLARVAWASGEPDLAIERYRDAVMRYPSVEYVAVLGDLYATIGRDDLAEQQYAVVDATRALAQANGVNVDLEIALFDADHGDPESALAAAEAEWARRQSVHVADAYAWALYANGRYAEAARVSKRALELGTRNAAFLFHAGMIELARGRDEAARGLLRRAVAINPNFSILYARTAQLVLAELEATP